MLRNCTLTFVALILALYGCGGGSSSSVSPIVGTWIVRSVQINSAPAQTCPTTVIFDGNPISCTVNDLSIFRSDGTFSDSNGASGSFTLNGSTLTILTPFRRTAQVTFPNNQMLITRIGTTDTGKSLFDRQ